MKILFTGNSYTFFNDLPGIVMALARENGKKLSAYEVTSRRIL